MKFTKSSCFLYFLWIFASADSKPSSSKDCECYCPESSDSGLCDRISKIETVLRTVVKAIADRTYLINEVKQFNIWKDSQIHVTDNLIAEMQQLKNRLDVEILPSSQPLIAKPDEKMQRDSDSGSGGFEEDKKEVTKEVSELIAKVEEVENRTIQVQEKLESERRVRRHLEESLNETMTSVHLLGDRLQNISSPESSKLTQVEEVILSTLEHINKTIFEDHLQKLYYKVDGVVYRNETKLLSERLNQVEIEVQESNNNNLTQLTMLLKNLEENVRQMNDSIQSELTPLYNIATVENVQMESIKHLEERLMLLSDKSDFLKRELEEVRNSIDIADSLQEKFMNFTEEWRSSLSYVGQQMAELKKALTQEKEDLPTFDESTTSVPAENETAASRTSNCVLPDVNQSNLLVTIETDESGNQSLLFGCSPIGQYVLNPVSASVRCENGIWQGLFPTCICLLKEEEIHELSNRLEKLNPCLNTNGTLIRDPTNCSRFFKCIQFRQMHMTCPGNLHFDDAKKHCVNPYNSDCVPFSNADEKSELRTLKDFIPPIHIQPNTLDKPYSLMGTGPLGEMIVYPGTTFTLQCLFPNTIFGQPTWFAYYFLTGLGKELANQKDGRFRYGLKIAAAKQSDSGVYSCRTPYGKESSVTIIVKEIECPPISDKEEIEEAVFYRPTPEGQHRIITASAQFQCEGGSTITAMCLANGTWSRKVPTADECHIRNTKANIYWGCPPLNFTNHPHLTVERDEDETKLIFNCKAGLNLIGPSSTICMEEKQWSHTSLPKCEKWEESYIGDQDVMNELLEDY